MLEAAGESCRIEINLGGPLSILAYNTFLLGFGNSLCSVLLGGLVCLLMEETAPDVFVVRMLLLT